MAKKKEVPKPEEEILVLHEKWVKAAKEHLREIIIVAITAVFLASLWAFYNYYRQKHLEEATLLYAKALMTTNEGQKKGLLEEVIKKYDGTTVSLEARLSLCEIYFEKGELKKAEEELKRVATKTKGALKVAAEMGVGYFAEDEKRYSDAARYYQKGASANIGLEEIAYFDLARVAELQKKWGDAVKYYQELISLKPAENKLDFLQVKLSRLMEKVGSKSKEGEG